MFAGRVESDRMDSDEEYDIGLPKIRQDECVIGQVDLNGIAAGKTEEFTFEMPDFVETAGYKQRGPLPLEKVLDRETVEQMELKFLANEERDALSVMFGDYSEIEPLMDDETEDGKVKKRILRPGTGATVVEGDMAVIHYLIGAEDMDDLIESTFETKRPRRFRIGTGEVLHVMDIGVRSMRVGEMSKFLATHEYAYGALGIPFDEGRVIPPESRVMVQMTLLETYASDKDNSIARMSSAERRDLPLEQLLLYGEEMKKEGNREFKYGDAEKALRWYMEALEAIMDMDLTCGTDKEKYFKLRQQVCNNLAHTYFKLGKFKRALRYAEDATEVPIPGLLKAKSHYWCAKVLFELGRFDLCSIHIDKAYCMRHDKDIRALKLKVEQILSKDKETEKEICSRMMSANLSENGN